MTHNATHTIHPAPMITADEITEWLDELVALYLEQAVRFACEDHARSLGLFEREDSTESWQFGLVRGMWYQLATAIVRAPIPPADKGRLFLGIEAETPAVFRMTDPDPDHVPPSDSDTYAETVYAQYARILQASDAQSYIDWQFSKQLLGLDPDDDTADSIDESGCEERE
ncbi:hypothetical protein [Nocardia huaxiensis]|uniref:Uncharacterized protein n=1 Tax=Nocardia huaxiensis TaxID=2755382 RepID=A0A7D6VF33_9NOCA|nr:hypothetical protein [Nocardia huaxiensis]QLY33994.1 hypothetical protein H0264_18720 [Nocardia huaxiensis]UFS99103.1 hypothetical protein LPY97_14990 [Nocardia huaxiensis]